MVSIIVDYMLIFLMGMLGIWKAVPLGLLLNAPPVGVFLMTSLGAIAGVLILFFFGSKIRNFVIQRRSNKHKNAKENRAALLFEKFGAAGLGFLGCLIMGPNMTIILGLVVVKSQKKLLYWTLTGIIVWSLALITIAVVSIDIFNRILEYFN
jgi:membrane protein YqaA with SNARE-associated domain